MPQGGQLSESDNRDRRDAAGGCSASNRDREAGSLMVRACQRLAVSALAQPADSARYYYFSTAEGASEWVRLRKPSSFRDAALEAFNVAHSFLQEIRLELADASAVDFKKSAHTGTVVSIASGSNRSISETKSPNNDQSLQTRFHLAFID